MRRQKVHVRVRAGFPSFLFSLSLSLVVTPPHPTVCSVCDVTTTTKWEAELSLRLTARRYRRGWRPIRWLQTRIGGQGDDIYHRLPPNHSSRVSSQTDSWHGIFFFSLCLVLRHVVQVLDHMLCCEDMTISTPYLLPYERLEHHSAWCLMPKRSPM